MVDPAPGARSAGAEGEPGARELSGFGRYLRILRLFDEARSQWTIPEIAEQLGTPASTIYRTVRELVAADILEASTESRYRLGAALIEFDRLVRVTDPLSRYGLEMLGDVAEQAQVPCVAVLARLYGDTVMCIADRHSPGDDTHSSYERGRPRPLTRGATSKMILAHLPSRRLSKLLARSSRQEDLDTLKKQLSDARRSGFMVTRGEVDSGLVGIAASIALPEHGIFASLSLVLHAGLVTTSVENRLVLLVMTSAKLLQNRLTSAE